MIKGVLQTPPQEPARAASPPAFPVIPVRQQCQEQPGVAAEAVARLQARGQERDL